MQTRLKKYLLGLPLLLCCLLLKGNILHAAKPVTGNRIPVPIQASPVEGKVTDSAGNPVAGATVKIKGKTSAVATAADGSFRINTTPGEILEISAIGFQSQEITVGNETSLQIRLSAVAAALDEVVVVGYGAQKRSNLTGAVTSISTKKLTDIPAANMSNTLAGRAPGVTVTNTSGLSGASSSIRIRGANGEPLYVIDGVIKGKAEFDALDPNEIDQLNVLKDAATASIYGSRAGNGVIVVTTKKGTAQKPTLHFQTSYSRSTPTRTLLSDRTTAIDELIYQNRVVQFNNEYNKKNDPLPNGETEFNYFRDKNYNVNDWVWRNPTVQKYLLDVSGGSEKLNYYNMVSYTGENGSYENLGYKKFNLRSNITAKITNDIKLNMNIAAAQQNSDKFYWPFSPDDDYDVSDFYRVTFNWPKLYPFYINADGTPADHITDYPVQTPMGSWQAWSVIDQVMGDRYIKTRKRQLNTIATLDINLHKITRGLAAKIVGNYEANDFLRKWYMTFQKNYVFIQGDPKNRFVPGPPDPNKVNIFNFSQQAPFLRYQQDNGWKYQFNAFLTYNRSFGKHTVDALAVFEQRQDHFYRSISTAYNPIANIDQFFPYSADPADRFADGLEGLGAAQSWIGRLNYNYANRYIVEASLRYDGNSAFAKGHKWGAYPSVSLAWRLSQESFFKYHVAFLNELKLRASYGTTGNDLNYSNIGDPQTIQGFLYKETYQNSTPYVFGDRLYKTIRPSPVPVPGLTWATVENKNIGLDFATLNSRLSGRLDFFTNRMKDILASRVVAIPDVYGTTPAPENYAVRSFKGAEFDVQWNDRAGKEWSYAVYANMGYARDRWDVLDEPVAYGPDGVEHFRTRIGQPEDRIYGFKALGIIRTQEQLDKLTAEGYNYYGRKPYMGAIIYEDIRGDGYTAGADGRIDGNDVQLLSKNGKPRVNYGFGFNVSWKGLSLDAHFQGVTSYDVMISNQDGPGIRQWGGNFRVYYPIWASDVWTPENPDARYPRVVGQNWLESGSDGSTFWIRNGAYMRLKNLNIGYTLPERWISHLKLVNAQVFLNGTNLFAISKLKEFQDPEQKNYDSYPVMKTLTAGLNLTF
ncbi:TonB-dependent receptor [Niabella sp. CC-SYL272]|uniref:SusC/RagA family TonB-linked outer membrane protein n=1 Tax=Niabella agricola TaxID=2891571 RepID=UPI001F288352|nr:TonB-dependent receptor [Niabella agricola]MCF3109103.1 TonB-dependent receptor [Niabella agricola]